MNKKILMTAGALLAVVAGVAAMSAYEAHVINVTAHIENALTVHPKEIAFGTVFPQEYVEEQFTVTFSSSFEGEGRVDDVEYVIKQKPKPLDATQEDPSVWTKPASCQQPLADVVEAREYCHDNPTDLTCCYRDLCQYLSKLSTDANDTSHPSYYVDPDGVPNSGDETCRTPGADATGRLSKIDEDSSDLWIVDLKVPPFKGFVAQDWPAGCPVIEGDENGEDFGCDLWIEVTNISETPPEPFCGDGNVDPGEQCDDGNNEDGDGCSAICEIEN